MQIPGQSGHRFPHDGCCAVDGCTPYRSGDEMHPCTLSYCLARVPVQHVVVVLQHRNILVNVRGHVPLHSKILSNQKGLFSRNNYYKAARSWYESEWEMRSVWTLNKGKSPENKMATPFRRGQVIQSDQTHSLFLSRGLHDASRHIMHPLPNL